jgi:hypothetical protein
MVHGDVIASTSVVSFHIGQGLPAEQFPAATSVVGEVFTT